MKIINKNFIISSILLLILLYSTKIFCGTTGKIAGTILDSSTNKPLPGCNIILSGTTMGAASNLNGEYFILNIPPGRYDIRVSMMGYKPVVTTKAQVTVDLTARIDFSLEPTILDIADEVTIIAERPLVQKDVTSKQTIVGATEITNMAVDNIAQVLVTKAGFTKDAEGNLHVRGGRKGEIAYMVDGMYIRNPLHTGFSKLINTHTLQPSNPENGITINEDAIDEMIVLSGAFNAEYGDAMSSIVNIVTKDGGNSYKGKVEYTSAMLNNSNYRQKNPFPGVIDNYDYIENSIIDDMNFKPLNLEIPITGMLNSSLSGPFPFIPKLSFFISGRYKNEDSYLPHGYSLERDGFAKFTYRFNPSLKLSLTNQSTQNEFQIYNHKWKYMSQNQNYNTLQTNRLGLTLTHMVNSNLFYTILLSRYENKFKTQVGDKQPQDYVMGQTGESVYFFVSGDDDNYADNKTVTYSSKVDFTYQANTYHQFKSGIEYRNYNIQTYEEKEPWPAGAQFKEEYTRKPVEFAAYIQDKIELDYLILNVGLRYDFTDPKSSMWPNIYQFGYFDENNEWRLAVEEDVKPKTQLSPRIGLAHPITENSVLHFSYGHFFQVPDYNALYYNHHKDLSTTLPLVGNSRVEPQKTVTYEAGLKNQITQNWAFDVTAWYKDITDLLSTLHISYLSQDYVVFYNSDYASVKGIDLTLRNRYNSYVSCSVDYTYMVAKGNNSQPLGGYIDAYYQEEIPHQEYYLDFDQRHDVAVNINFTIPEGKGPELFGLKPFSDTNLNLIFQAASGLPYTPYVDPTLRVEINSARKPLTSTIDLRLIKVMKILGFKTAMFTEITNLLDRENVVHVYSRTGKPYDTGIANLVGSSPDADHNPLHVGPPRIIKAGFQFLW